MIIRDHRTLRSDMSLMLLKLIENRVMLLLWQNNIQRETCFSSLLTIDQIKKSTGVSYGEVYYKF